MQEMQNEGDLTALMVLLKEMKTAPFGDVWEEYLRRQNVAADYITERKEYENKVLSARN